MGKYLDGDGLSHLWAKIKSAFTNVQADWDEADPTSDAYILNKPTIPPGSVVDSALDPTSTNPVQNAVITQALYQYRGEEDTDLNDCTDIGVYYYTSTATNIPVSGAGGTLLVTPGPGNYLMQVSIPRDTNGESKLFYRQYTSSNTWGDWYRSVSSGEVSIDFAHYNFMTTLASSQVAAWADNTVYLPSGSGTLALTSQIPTVQDITSTDLSAADTSKATIGNLKLYALGSMRILEGYITAVSALGTSQLTVANISTGNRPAVQVAVSCSWDSARYVTWGVVGTGGAIAIRSSSSYSSGNLRMNAVWIVE